MRTIAGLSQISGKAGVSISHVRVGFFLHTELAIGPSSVKICLKRRAARGHNLPLASVRDRLVQRWRRTECRMLKRKNR